MLLHIPIGGTLSRLCIERQRMRCPACGWCRADPIPFRAEGHMCTEELVRYAEDLLAYGFTLVFCQVEVVRWDCGGNLGPNPSYATRPKSLRYCMGLL